MILLIDFLNEKNIRKLGPVMLHNIMLPISD